LPHFLSVVFEINHLLLKLQEYAAKLLRNTQRGRSFASEPDTVDASGTAGTGKIRLLRKQLEDARYKETK
jgi:hypothetical protein